MNHGDFIIGTEFTCGERMWFCTDVGSRVIVAVCIQRLSLERVRAHQPQKIPCGPPYTLTEQVFDEFDMPGCERTNDDAK